MQVKPSAYSNISPILSAHIFNKKKTFHSKLQKVIVVKLIHFFKISSGRKCYQEILWYQRHSRRFLGNKNGVQYVCLRMHYCVVHMMLGITRANWQCISDLPSVLPGIECGAGDLNRVSKMLDKCFNL